LKRIENSKTNRKLGKKKEQKLRSWKPFLGILANSNFGFSRAEKENPTWLIGFVVLTSLSAPKTHGFP